MYAMCSGAVGRYWPAFFTIYVQDIYDKKTGEFQNGGWTILAHELTHYLQNFLTLNGQQRIIQALEEINDFRLKHAQSYTISYSAVKNSLPHTIANAGVQVNQTLLNTYKGDTAKIQKCSHIETLRIDAVRIDTMSVPIVLAGIIVVPGSSLVSRAIGCHDLLESMAYTVELLLGSTESSPVFPYQVDQIILQHYKLMDVHPLIRLMLLEHALQAVDNAAPFYVDMVNRLAEHPSIQVHNQISKRDMDAFWNWLRQQKPIEIGTGIQLDTDQIRGRYATTIANYKSNVSGGIAGRNSAFIDRITAFIVANPVLPVTHAVCEATRITGGKATLDSPKSFVYFVMDTYGVPLIKDLNNQVLDLPGANNTAMFNDMRVFAALATFHDVIFHPPSRECLLLEYCRRFDAETTTRIVREPANEAEILRKTPMRVDKFCDTSPLERINEKYRCEFDQVMMGHGLTP